MNNIIRRGISIVTNATGESRGTLGAEIAGAHRSRWSQGSSFIRGTVHIILPGCEDECAILTVIQLWNRKRTADRSAILVLPQRRQFGIKVAGGVHHLVAQELPSSTMILVGSGFCDHAHHGSDSAAVLGQIVVTLALELLNGVHDGRIVVGSEIGRAHV